MTAFDPAKALHLAAFVESVASTYTPGCSATPENLANVPDGYDVFGWITIREFFLRELDPVFFGAVFKARDSENYVLAIRGTQDNSEWWANGHFWQVPFSAVPSAGSVEDGFDRLYSSFNFIPVTPNARVDQVREQAKASFANLIAAAIRTDEVSRYQTASIIPHFPSLDIAGHSLGGALATLFMIDASSKNELNTTSLFTIASPRVGDATFAETFAMTMIQRKIDAWRIFNKPDLTPNLPPDVWGYEHVGEPIMLDSSSDPGLRDADAHALTTYKALLSEMVPSSVLVGATSVAATPMKFDTPGDQALNAASATIAPDPGFPGSAPLLLRIPWVSPAPLELATGGVDANGEWLDTSRKWLDKTSGLITVHIKYFWAPTFFENRSKDAAYLKCIVSQDFPQTPLSKPLQWTVLVSLQDKAGDDIQTTDFSSLTNSPDVVNGLVNIPLPQGAGNISMFAGAITGDDYGKFFQILFSTYDKLRKLADPDHNPNVGALIPALAIPAASLFVADQVEALMQQVLQTFSNPQLETYFDASPMEFTISKGNVGPGVANLPSGKTFLVVIPAKSNAADGGGTVVDYQKKVMDAMKAPGAANYSINTVTFEVEVDSGESVFAGIPYFTLAIDVEAAPT